MTINNPNPKLVIALDPGAFHDPTTKDAATRRYLAEEIVNRIDHLAKFAGIDQEEILTRIARYRVNS